MLICHKTQPTNQPTNPPGHLFFRGWGVLPLYRGYTQSILILVYKVDNSHHGKVFIQHKKDFGKKKKNGGTKRRVCHLLEFCRIRFRFSYDDRNAQNALKEKHLK